MHLPIVKLLSMNYSMFPDCYIFPLGIGISLIVMTMVLFTILIMHVTVSNENVSLSHDALLTRTIVPFVATSDVDWKIIRRSLENHQAETKKTLEHLSMTLEVVEQEEQRIQNSEWKLSNHIRNKINHLSDLYDHDFEVLELLLMPFPTVYALPVSEANELLGMGVRQVGNSVVDVELISRQKTEINFTWFESRTTALQHQTYDAVRQVVAHIVRDWSHTDGAPIRASIYDWCIDQLRKHGHAKHRGPVLVPGAGLGRLAWEISIHFDFAVEAMECSICMAAAAHAIFNRSVKNGFELHPFATDSFSNEISNEARYDIIKFPDVDVTHRGSGSLSFTIGTFGFETMQHCYGSYSAIVTSFFVDTATTVYDFVGTVEMILADDGIWINVGPLQWHINNQVPVSVDEFRMILEKYRNRKTGKRAFDILHWCLDRKPIPYRNGGTKHRSTYFDAYCPLRFVVRKRVR